jgi:hypothetical protein
MKLSILLVLLVLALSGCADNIQYYYRYCIDGYDRPINCETGAPIVTVSLQDLHDNSFQAGVK